MFKQLNRDIARKMLNTNNMRKNMFTIFFLDFHKLRHNTNFNIRFRVNVMFEYRRKRFFYVIEVFYRKIEIVTISFILLILLRLST